MFSESETGYLLSFILYTGTTTEYTNPPINLLLPFGTYKSPLKVVLSLLHGYLIKSYCLTLDIYYTSPEVTNVLLVKKTDCYGT